MALIDAGPTAEYRTVEEYYLKEILKQLLILNDKVSGGSGELSEDTLKHVLLDSGGSFEEMGGAN